MPIFNITNGQTSSNTHSSQLVVTTEGESGTLVKLEGDNLSTALTKPITSDGTVTFSNLIDGDYQVSMKSDIHTNYTDAQTITLNSSISFPVYFFKATVTVTFPTGRTCTATNGTTTYTSTSTPWTCTIYESGTWTFSLDTGFYEEIIVNNGQSYTINKWYLYKDGNEYNQLTGAWISFLKQTPTVSKYPDHILVTTTTSTNEPAAKLHPTEYIKYEGFTTLKAIGSITSQVSTSKSKLYLGCEIASTHIFNPSTGQARPNIDSAAIPTSNFVSSGSTAVQEYELSLDITNVPSYDSHGIKQTCPYFLIYCASGTLNSMWVEC